MGAAYLASHPVLKTPLVVKTFVPTIDDPFAEAHLAARVSSPHVVSAVDAGFEDAVPFVVLRYVDGIDLGELIDHTRAVRRTVPIGEVARILRDVATGLHAIHQCGVVHRDVKPRNLFLSGGGDALVGDFGIAVDRALGPEGQLAGTPLFIAPEVWRRESVDPRADIYSLGAAAHLLATGEVPFAGTMEELARAHTKEDYVPPRSARPEAAYLFALIESMLAKAPVLRPPTCEHVARTLAPIATESPKVVLTSPTTAEIGATRVELYRGDIAEARGDVIVNAANWQMTMRVGVAEALRTAGGDAIQTEAVGGAPAAMGDVVWTGAGHLNARWVAHAVSALAGAVCLQRCTLRVLFEAEARGAHRVVFPAIGTGVGGVPMAQGASLVLAAIRTFAGLGVTGVDTIAIALLDDASLEQWATVLRGM